MKIVTREFDARMGGVVDIEVELGALTYVTRHIPIPSLTSACYRSDIGIENLASIEIDRETDTGMTMGIVRAVGTDPGIGGNLGIEMAGRTSEGEVVTGILGRIGMTLATELEGEEKDLLTLGAKEEEMTVGIETQSLLVGRR